jgi:hypothetical protein
MNSTVITILSLSVSGSILALILLAGKPLLKSRVKGDYTEQLYNEDYSLWFTESYDDAGQESWILSAISVKTSIIETTEGLKTGDADNKVKEIYGPCENIKEDEAEGHTYYYYEMENYILRISSGGTSGEDNAFSWKIMTKSYADAID